MSQPFIGEVVPFAIGFPPAGYAQCNGQLVPLDQNPQLAHLLGTSFGGDGTRTFGLPDLRGRVGIGTGAGPGLTPREIGKPGGVETVLLTPETTGPHGHGAGAVKGVGLPPQQSPTDARWAASPENPYAIATGDVPMAPDTYGPSDPAQPHNNVSPYLAVQFCIALVGIYPSRP